MSSEQFWYSWFRVMFLVVLVINQGFSWLLKGVPGLILIKLSHQILFAVEKGRPPFYLKAEWSFFSYITKAHCIVSSYVDNYPLVLF